MAGKHFFPWKRQKELGLQLNLSVSIRDFALISKPAKEMRVPAERVEGKGVGRTDIYCWKKQNCEAGTPPCSLYSFYSH